MSDKIVRFSVKTQRRFDRNLGIFVLEIITETLAKCSICGMIYNICYLYNCRKKSVPDGNRETDKT